MSKTPAIKKRPRKYSSEHDWEPTYCRSLTAVHPCTYPRQATSFDRATHGLQKMQGRVHRGTKRKRRVNFAKEWRWPADMKGRVSTYLTNTKPHRGWDERCSTHWTQNQKFHLLALETRRAWGLHPSRSTSPLASPTNETKHHHNTTTTITKGGKPSGIFISR